MGRSAWTAVFWVTLMSPWCHGASVHPVDRCECDGKEYLNSCVLSDVEVTLVPWCQCTSCRQVWMWWEGVPEQLCFEWYWGHLGVMVPVYILYTGVNVMGRSAWTAVFWVTLRSLWCHGASVHPIHKCECDGKECLNSCVLSDIEVTSVPWCQCTSYRQVWMWWEGVPEQLCFEWCWGHLGAMVPVYILYTGVNVMGRSTWTAVFWVTLRSPWCHGGTTGLTPDRGAIKSPRSTQPFIPPG